MSDKKQSGSLEARPPRLVSSSGPMLVVQMEARSHGDGQRRVPREVYLQELRDKELVKIRDARVEATAAATAKRTKEEFTAAYVAEASRRHAEKEAQFQAQKRN